MPTDRCQIVENGERCPNYAVWSIHVKHNLTKIGWFDINESEDLEVCNEHKDYHAE